MAEPGRAASVYVFAHHPVIGPEADHRDPPQWRFWVVRSADLPAGKRIGLAAVTRLADECGWDALAARVERACA